MNNQLVRLPGGAWLRPSSVVAVRPLDGLGSEQGGVKFDAEIPPRVVVEYSERLPGGSHKRSAHHVCCEIACDTFEAAQALADELATKFNLETAKPGEMKCT